MPENAAIPLLKDICFKKIPISLNYCIKSPCPKGNCSIIPYKNNSMYLCSFREFSYDLLTTNRYSIQYEPKSKNIWCWFCLLNPDFTPFKTNFQQVNVVNFPNLSSYVKNLEDIRLVPLSSEDGAMYASATLKYKNEENHFGTFRVTDNNWKITLERLFSSNEIHPTSCKDEKNWMWIPGTMSLVHWVKCNNTEIFDLDGRQFRTIQHDDGIIAPDGLRGSTNLMKIGDDFVCLTHIRRQRRYYVNRFCVFDSQMKLKHISREFKFDGIFGVEIAMSMFNQIDSDNIGITVCEMDAFQYVYLFDRSKLLDFIYN